MIKNVTGLTTGDIASGLAIAVRTAQFHWDCIRTKLATATRREAVAERIAEAFVRREHHG